MRVTIKIDSATDAEAQSLIFAHQRARNLLAGGDADCTVSMVGVGWTITTPPVGQHHATLVMEDFTTACNERATAALTRLLSAPPPVGSLTMDYPDGDQ